MARPKLTEEQREASEARRREQQKKYTKRWQEKNREHIREYVREWRKKNPEKYSAAQIRYHQKKIDTITEVKHG